MPGAYLGWISYVPEHGDAGCCAPRRLGPATSTPRGGRLTAGATPLDRLLALNIDTYLLDDLLVKMDRMSMAHGLEVRSPFLDTDAARVRRPSPPRLKVRGLSLKRVLKRAVAELLPEEILSRPKRGFGVPLDRWFREDLDTYTQSMLGPRRSVRGHLERR